MDAQPRSDDKLDQTIGYLVGDVSRLFRKLFDRRVQSLGLTRSQWQVLAHLQRREGVSQSQLAGLLEIEKPTLGRLIDRLEAKGWVERRNDVNDRRTNRMYLTDQARPLLDEMKDLARQVVDDALFGVGDESVSELTRNLLMIKENLLRQVNVHPPGKK